MGCECLDFQTPSIDRPFGIYLWGIVDKLYERYFGYPATEFEFEAGGGLPMSTWKEVCMAMTCYYIMVFGGQYVMKGMQPIRLNRLFQLHNLILTLLSLALAMLTAEQVIPIIVRRGMFDLICSVESWDQKLVFLYYLNYLTKYMEFIDTSFLIMKKRPVIFLHWFHHSMTALLCFTQLIGRTPVSAVPIQLNLIVHVFMYAYYFVCSLGIYPPLACKRMITISQIVQFVIDLVAVYLASYTYFTSTYWPWMPNMGRCAGEEFAAFSGCAILTSYLLLFLAFYKRVYKKDKSVRTDSKGRKEGPVAAATKATYDPSPSPRPGSPKGAAKVSKSKKA